MIGQCGFKIDPFNRSFYIYIMVFYLFNFIFIIDLLLKPKN